MFCTALGAALVLLVTATVALAAPPTATDAETARAFAACERATSRWERISDVPQGLLQAISLAESGRWSEPDKRVRAWPWTVTSGGPGSYYPTKAAALAEVARLQARGVQNIDVGCMQVNMGFHGQNFESVAHAMDPDINVAYAAKFLTNLRANADSWAEAAGYYHSMTPERTAYYRSKVEKFWAGLTNRAPGALASVDALSQPSAAKPQETSFLASLEVTKPEADLYVAPIDPVRTAELNARFEKLKTAARKLRDDLDPQSKRERQMEAWRDARGRADALQALLARRQAELQAKREREIAFDKVDRDDRFRENRLRQMQEWRTRVASGS